MISTVGEPEREVRVSDAERNVVVEALRTHTADGRLTLDEFAERVEVALAARTRADLDEVLRDLPAVLPTAAPTPQPSSSRRPVRSTIAIWSHSEQKGRWRLEGEHTAFACMGGAVVDLRQAEIVGGEVTINAIAIMGGVDVIVPEGIEVELTGVAIMGGKQSKLKGHKVLPGSPRVRVNVFAIWGGVCVKSKTTREWVADKHERRHAERIDRAREKIDLARESGVLPASGPPPPPFAGPHRQRDRDRERTRRRSRLPEGTVTLLVTDIEGSTAMAEAMGDLRFRQLLSRHDEVVQACVDQHGGHVVKGTGDGFLLAFSSARQALLCASELQHEFADGEVSVRMGVHSGEVVRSDSDLYGKTVIVASRLAGAARGGEVLVSEITKALTESGGDLRFDASRQVELKGLSDPQQAWTLDWST